MLQPEFQLEIERLKGHYGERHFGPQLVDILWEEFNGLDRNDFRKITLECIATRSLGRPPLRDDFREIGKAFNIANKTIKKNPIPDEVKGCPGCDGIGYVFVENISDGREAIASCEHCARGRYFASKSYHHVIVSTSHAEKLGWKFKSLAL